MNTVATAPLLQSTPVVPEDSPATRPAVSPIEIILYLASLASRPADIDALLEPMREVTANLGPGQQPSEADNERLAMVQRDLKQYLIEKEPLRRFTAESLEHKLAERFSHHAQGVKRSVVMWLCGIAVASILPFFVFPASAGKEITQIMSTICMLAGFAFGAGWFIATSVRDFRFELRAAYRLIGIGIILFGLALFIQPFRTYTGASDIEWRHLEYIIVPFVLGHIPFYFGIGAFARRLGVAQRLSSLWLLCGLLLITSTIAALLPHVATYAEEMSFDISVIALAWCATMNSLAVCMMVFTIRRIGNIYASPMRWLLAGYVLISLTDAEFLFIRYLIGYLPPGPGQILSYVPTLIGFPLLFIAAVKFKRTSRY